MKGTKSSEDKHADLDHVDGANLDKSHRSAAASKQSLKSSHGHIATAHSENGDVTHTPEKSHSHTKLSNGEVPSFMKPTKCFEIRDRHNEEAMLQQEQDRQPTERRGSTTRKVVKVPLVEGEGMPSYMRKTKAHETREAAVATGTAEISAFDLALQGPMIDGDVIEPPPLTKTKKNSVGGFLRKKFGIGKGEFYKVCGKKSLLKFEIWSYFIFQSFKCNYSLKYFLSLLLVN